MAHIRYDVNRVPAYVIQTGGNYAGFRFQRSYIPQRGRGIGGVLARAWRYLLPLAKTHLKPLAKTALKAIGEEGLEAGQKFLKDIAEGKDAKESVITEGTEALKNLMKRAGSKLTQAGSGAKRKRLNGNSNRTRRRSRPSVANLHVVGRSVLEKTARKRRRPQNAGLY